MASINRIEIRKQSIPYAFQIQLTNFGAPKTYTIGIKYNDVKGYFTIDVSDIDGTIINGLKLLYGSPIFSKIMRTRLPDEVIVPLDPNGVETRITLDNLDESVNLYVFEPGVFV